MSLESSIRYGNAGAYARVFNHGGNAQHYGTPDPFEDSGRRVDWRWMDLWEQENPNPNQAGEAHDPENFSTWFEEHSRMRRRCWAQFHFPHLRIMEWGEEDLTKLFKLVSRHICSVCGRADDPGCTEGC